MGRLETLGPGSPSLNGGERKRPLLHHLSSSAACHLLPAAAEDPGPRVSSLPRRDKAWHRTVKTPRRRLRAEIAKDLSPSSVLRCPFLPLDTPATRTLEVARAASRD